MLSYFISINFGQICNLYAIQPNSTPVRKKWPLSGLVTNAEWIRAFTTLIVEINKNIKLENSLTFL